MVSIVTFFTINVSSLLNATAGNATSTYGGHANSHGIKTSGTLTIDGTASVTANGGAVNGQNVISSGVSGNVILNGGSLTTIGGTVSDSTESSGIYGNVTVTAGTLSATGDDFGITEETVVNGGALTVCGRNYRAINDSFTYPIGDNIKANTSAVPGSGGYEPANKDTYKWITVREPLVFNNSADYNIPEGTAETSFTSPVALTATGGTAPYVFTIDPA